MDGCALPLASSAFLSCDDLGTATVWWRGWNQVTGAGKLRCWKLKSSLLEVEILSAHTSLLTDSYGVVGVICISEEPSFSFGPMSGCYFSYLILTMSIVLCWMWLVMCATSRCLICLFFCWFCLMSWPWCFSLSGRIFVAGYSAANCILLFYAENAWNWHIIRQKFFCWNLIRFKEKSSGMRSD
jgi:hypothetical protein